MSPTTSRPAPKVGFGRTVAVSLLVLAVIPAALAVLWALGRLSDNAAAHISQIGVSWSHIGIGAAVVAGYAAVVGVVHAVRSYRARTAAYRHAAGQLLTDIDRERV